MKDQTQLSIDQLDQIRETVMNRTQEVADAIRALEQIRNELSTLLGTIDKMTLEHLKIAQEEEE